MIFNIVKLTTTPKNLISGQYMLLLPDFVIIDREEEYKIE